jgi:uncharacterized protein (TIGR03083 family)
MSLDHANDCAALATETEAFAALLDGADLATPVPTCPGWDLLALAKHAGVVQRWAAQMMHDGATERLDFRSVDRALPDEPAGYAAWFRASGALALEQLRAHDAATAVWTWGPGHTVGWWARRLLHETAVHRADAALALGVPAAVEPAVAVDGIDELLENLPAAAASFAPAVAELTGKGETLHLHATDAEGEWMIELTPEGFTWAHCHGKGDVAVRGAASDLLLLVYGRLPSDDERFTRFGDTDLLDRWLRLTAI